MNFHQTTQGTRGLFLFQARRLSAASGTPALALTDLVAVREQGWAQEALHPLACWCMKQPRDKCTAYTTDRQHWLVPSCTFALRSTSGMRRSPPDNAVSFSPQDFPDIAFARARNFLFLSQRFPLPSQRQFLFPPVHSCLRYSWRYSVRPEQRCLALDTHQGFQHSYTKFAFHLPHR